MPRFGLDEETELFWYLVCGGRDYADRAMVHAVLRRLNYDSPGTVGILHGAARGADTLAGEWARANRIPCRPMPADWPRFGRMAGPVRNQQMLDEHPGHVLLVVAFPGGRGTLDMMTKARAAGIPVLQVAGVLGDEISKVASEPPFPADEVTPVRPYGKG